MLPTACHKLIRRICLFRIGVVEKGYVDVELETIGKAGHSSVPPKETPISIISQAIAQLTKYKQPNMFGLGPEKHMLEYAAYHVS